MLQTLPAERAGSRPDVAASSGFSLHAGVFAQGSEREKLEHLARYVSRPPVAGERLALTERGQVRYALQTRYRDGTTHVIFEPDDFIARLAALVPKPSNPPPTRVRRAQRRHQGIWRGRRENGHSGTIVGAAGRRSEPRAQAAQPT